MKILIIEDEKEKEYGEAFKMFLEKKENEVDICLSVMEGFKMIDDTHYDIIIIASEVGDLSGFHFIDLMQERMQDHTIVMLARIKSLKDEIQALEKGLDEYLYREESFELLYTRINWALQKTKQINYADKLVSKPENIELDLINRVVVKNGEEINISYVEFEILSYLIKNKNKVITRTMFLDEAWDGHTTTNERVIDTHIKNIRTKLQTKMIKSIRSVGYKWCE